MSLATGEGEAYPIDRPGRSGRLLPHHPLRGSFPRWGKHRRPSDNGQGQAPPLRSSPPSPVSLRGQCALPPLKGEVSPALAPVTEGFLRSLRPPQGRLSAARVPAPVPDRRAGDTRPYGANPRLPVGAIHESPARPRLRRGGACVPSRASPSLRRGRRPRRPVCWTWVRIHGRPMVVPARKCVSPP